jgi:hypothetical protein
MELGAVHINGEPMNIVMATDGSEAAIDAARRSVDLLRPGAQVTLVIVIPEYEDPMEDAGGIEGPGISYEKADSCLPASTTTGDMFAAARWSRWPPLTTMRGSMSASSG